MYIGAATVEHSMEVSQNTKNRATIGPSNSTPGYISPQIPLILKNTGTPEFIAALFMIAKTWKQPKCPLTDEWIKVWCLYTMEYNSAIKKEQHFAIFSNMDGLGGH